MDWLFVKVINGNTSVEWCETEHEARNKYHKWKSLLEGGMGVRLYILEVRDYISFNGLQK